MPENLEKFRSTELYGAALEGSTFFLCRSSLGSTSMESCQLADLKYAIFSSTGYKTKKAGPALFRGRLRAFGKCTNGVAFLKGRPNLASVRLTL